MWWRNLLAAIGVAALGWFIADPNRQNMTADRASFGLAVVCLAFVIIATVKAPGAKKLLTVALGLPSIILAGASCEMSYVTFGAKSKESDAKTHLKSLYESEQRYFAKHATYTSDLEALGWKPERSRYTFVLAPGHVVAADASMTPCGPSSAPNVNAIAAEKLTIAAWANIDCDPFVDVWTISSEARTSADGTVVPPGTLLHDQEDAVFARQP